MAADLSSSSPVGWATSATQPPVSNLGSLMSKSKVIWPRL